MIDRDGQRFYTAADINHGRVRDAMKAAGSRTQALPLEELGHTGYRRAKATREVGRRRRGHQYGPHRPEDAPTVIEVKGAGRYAPATIVPISPALLEQRAYINHRAHEDAKR